MKQLPTPPSPGKPVSATLIRQLIAAIRERTILPGRNTSVKRGPNGTTVDTTMSAPGSASRQPTYWTFSCTEDPDSGERTGGWKNCRLQVGLNCLVASEDVFGPQSNLITGTEQTDDGVYYVEVDLRKETGEIKRKEPGELVPENDVMHDKVNISIGEVVEKKLTTCIDMIPVVYKYL